MSLPPPAPNQAYCDVSPLDAGHVFMHLGQLIDTAGDDEITDLPVLAFLLRHSRTGATLLFDLGVRPDPENFSAGARALAAHMRMRVTGSDVAAALDRGGLPAARVQHVALSHIHFDHTGVPAAFPGATFLLGAGARPLIERLAPDFEGTLYSVELPLERTTFLDPAGWAPLGLLPRALDLYGDGSLYVVDAPGHMGGHINIMARTSADGGWVYLAGDSAHDWRLLSGEAGIGNHRLFGCIHEDAGQAQENIDRLKALKGVPRVRVMLAHDRPWVDANMDGRAYWPGKVPSL